MEELNILLENNPIDYWNEFTEQYSKIYRKAIRDIIEIIKKFKEE